MRSVIQRPSQYHIDLLKSRTPREHAGAKKSNGDTATYKCNEGITTWNGALVRAIAVEQDTEWAKIITELRVVPLSSRGAKPFLYLIIMDL